jgi:predicted Zn-dependent peptidase
MKKSIMALSAALLLGGIASAQKVDFEEYDLDNGMHVILHNDPSAPVVVTSVMYHVGAKDENPERTGFAHFFEHLLFEGTENIKRGEWMKIVSSNGGVNNANTTDDRTYYYEIFPSNNLELGLWMESERMMHPVINQIGVDTQNEVVKEEKRTSFDNRPYGNILTVVKENMFKNHPYRWNTVLVVAGQIDIAQTKEWIKKYFGAIPRGEDLKRQTFTEEPITQPIKATYQDPNIQIPMLVASYRTPSMKTRDARVLNLISSYLSDGKSSKLYKKIVDQKKMALQIGAVGFSEEDYGMYIMYGLPMGTFTMADLLKEIDEEILKIQTDLISEKDYQKLQNTFDNQFVNANAGVEGIAENLAKFYMLYGDVNLINSEIDLYHSITREEIRDVAKKYLNPNQRLILDYVPSTEQAQN